MANTSAPDSTTLMYSALRHAPSAYEDRTVAMPSPHAFDSEVLDAHALFGDLHLHLAAPVTAIHANGAGLMLPPPPAVVILTPTATTHPRRNAATVRVRRAAPVDPQRARLVGIVICGSLALVAALVACFFYSAMPRQGHATTTATTTVTATTTATKTKATGRVPAAVVFVSAKTLVTYSAAERAPVELDEVPAPAPAATVASAPAWTPAPAAVAAAPAAAPAKTAKPSVDEILAALGEEQLRR